MRMRMHQVLSGVALLLVLSMTTAVGQFSHVLAGKIPFDFHVGKYTMPAGDYVLRLSTNPRCVQIRSKNGAAIALVFTVRSERRNPDKIAKLIFNRYGSEYFMSKIVSADTQIGHELLKEKLERELAASVAGSPPTQVALEMR